MNKKIWLTGALSIIAIFITVFIYNNFILDKNAVEPERAAGQDKTSAAAVDDDYHPVSADYYTSLTEGGSDTLTYSNDIFTAVFSADGGKPVSLLLNRYDSSGGGTEMIFSAESGQYPFSIHDGGYEAAEITGRFEGHVYGNDVVFKGRFRDKTGSVFELTKKYSFVPGSYMFRFTLGINSPDGPLPTGDDDFLYSLGMGPQLGPGFSELERGYVYRYFCLIDNGEKRNIGTPEDERKLSLNTPYKWLGVEGRYFTGITIPGFEGYSPAWDERSSQGIFKRNTYYIRRIAPVGERVQSIEDVYYVYFGPKDKEILGSFNESAAGGIGVSDPELEVVTAQNPIVSVSSAAVKAALGLLHRLIPNYGLGIILFVLIIQAAIFPLSRKTYDNAIKMQLLGPALAELREKYKYNDEKMNKESMKLFEQNDIKPRSSMLPFIIHLPFFILTYVLLLTNIDFRLEPFIPGWITDISVPEYIIDISPAVVPVTGWDKIRLLPLISLALSLIQSRYIQAPADAIRSMRLMSYLIPVVMFLVIYNMPSGAVLYWLTMVSTNLLIQWRIKSGYVNKK